MLLYGVKFQFESGVVSEMIAIEGEHFHLRQVGMLILRDKMTRVNMT